MKEGLLTSKGIYLHFRNFTPYYASLQILKLAVSGQKWQQRRKILTPAFHFNILKQFCTIFVEQSDRLVEMLHETKGEPVDVFPFITDFTLHSICGTLYTLFNHTYTVKPRYNGQTQVSFLYV